MCVTGRNKGELQERRKELNAPKKKHVEFKREGCKNNSKLPSDLQKEVSKSKKLEETIDGKQELLDEMKKRLKDKKFEHELSIQKKKEETQRMKLQHQQNDAAVKENLVQKRAQSSAFVERQKNATEGRQESTVKEAETRLF